MENVAFRRKALFVNGVSEFICKGSGDAVLLSPPRGAVVQLNLPGKQSREE